MSDGTKIEWTDATVNAVNGCSVVSPGCTNCYAMRLAGTRLRNHPSRAGLTQMTKAGPVWTGEVRLNEQALLAPLRWRKPRMIFWNAHGDLFHPKVPDAWIEGQADVGQGKAIKDALPTFETGQGVVWLPGRGILETTAFPAKLTFDSSRTPKRGERKERRELKALDLGALKDRLASVEQEAKANDPRALKAEVARLTRELAAASNERAKTDTAPAWPDQREEVAALVAELSECVDAMDRLRGGAEELQRRQKAALAALSGEAVELPRAPERQRPAPLAATPAPAPVPRQPAPVREPRQSEGNGALTGPQRNLLSAMAWWKAMGHDEPTRVQLAAKAGWTPKGSNLRNRLAELATAGLVEYPRTGLVRLTEAGIASAPAPDTSMTLIDSIRAVLTGPQSGLFEALLGHGDTMTRADLAAAVGWEPQGSNLRNRLAEMSALELVEYPGRGEVRLQQWVIG